MRSQRGLPARVISDHEFRSGAGRLVVLTGDDGAAVCATALGHKRLEMGRECSSAEDRGLRHRFTRLLDPPPIVVDG